MNYNQVLTGCQDADADMDGLDGLNVLMDRSGTGRERPWTLKKSANMVLANAYDTINPNKAIRLRECATVLTFAVDEGGRKQLVNMNSCRVRLCPMCGWRRSLKTYAHVRQIVDALEGQYQYLLLTLTVRNCVGTELSTTIDLMMDAWVRLMKKPTVKKAVKGWYRGLEVTHNVDRQSSWYDTYHPHFHVLLAVDKQRNGYISQQEWVELWRASLKVDDYTPVVDIRRVQGTTASAIAEVAKYAVKDADYIIPDNWDLTVDAVQVLDGALDGRRLVAFGGALKEMRKRLRLDDEIDGDLTEIGDTETQMNVVREEVYYWHTGYKQYIRYACA